MRLFSNCRFVIASPSPCVILTLNEVKGKDLVMLRTGSAKNLGEGMRFFGRFAPQNDIVGSGLVPDLTSLDR